MKYVPLLIALSLSSLSLSAEEAPATNLPPDPFANLESQPVAPGYPVDLDRSRGSFVIQAADGEYTDGDHFSNWRWNFTAKRWGNYYIGLKYQSSRAKQGIQIKVADTVLKGYAARTNPLVDTAPLTLGLAYLPKKGDYPLAMLVGGGSNDPDFQIEGIQFSPAPESKPAGQSIDGSVVLAANEATTFAEQMRYEPKEKKQCLGIWTDPKDWAEWEFPITKTGDFQLSVFYGCGKGNGGSEVALYLNDQTHTFTVEETGGFQEWKELDLGTVTLSYLGTNRLAIVPQNKTGNAVMDIKKVTLTPVKLGAR